MLAYLTLHNLLWLAGLSLGAFILALIIGETHEWAYRNPKIAFPYKTVEEKAGHKADVDRFGAMLDRATIAPGGRYVYYKDGTGIYHGPGGAEGRYARGDVDYDEATDTYYAHH